MQNNKLKIAFVAPSLKNGGAERVVSALANFFSKDHEIIIITQIEAEIFYDLNPEIKVIPLRNGTPSENSFSALYANGIAIKKMNKIIRSNNTDIIISFCTQANIFSLITARLTKIPCIISERKNPNNPSSFIWRQLSNLLYRSANCLVVQTKGSKEFYSQKLNDSNIHVVRNPISEKIGQLQKKSSNQSNVLNILTVGRLIPLKAQHLTIEALHKFKHLNWHLTIVGGGPSMEKLNALSKTLDIQDRVTFTGSVKDVTKYYQKADIFVFTSRTEGLPNSLIEAHYSGIPCISTSCDFGPDEIITDGKDGFLIPVDDSVMLRKKLEILITNPEKRNDFSRNARMNKDRFEMKKIAAEWQHLIQNALAN